ncbi:MAG: hypothetical protein PHC28_08485 [Flavobacterium sp.]|uniref:hypothetical protein n=1 Tax=Flavobacterium sp. TaxID=239 RepID=UPI00262A1EE9|nr:hypothetical protein [Flavobacterium sp.]MDD5150504.1 hypothetical protein [Flavobacterium sp.]
MKNRKLLLILKTIFLGCLFVSFSAKSQIQFGLKKVNVFTDISYSSPEKEMKNFYTLGDLMKFYIGAEVPFLAANYSKKSTTGLSVAALLDHEIANFSSNNYLSEGLNAKMTSLGIRVRPFANMAVYSPKGKIVDGYYIEEITHKVKGTDEFGNSKYSEYTTTESTPIWSDEGAKLLVTMFLSGLYFDYGKTNLDLIEHPFNDVNRTATMYSYGCSPSLGTGGKVTMFIDLGIRHYKWINSLNTTSGIKTWHIGFGVGFNLK